MELVRQKNVATRVVFPLVDADGDLVTGASGLDSEIDEFADGSNPSGFTDCTNEATEIGSTGIYYLNLTQTEMNQDYLVVQIKSSSAKTQVLLISTMVGDPLNFATSDDGGAFNVAAGVIEAQVKSIDAGAITAAAIATNAIDADAVADGAITSGVFATGAITADALAADAGTEIGTAVWATATRTLSALDEDSTTLDLDATIRSAVGLASANLDTQLDALPTAAENADAVWDEDATAHQTGGTFGQAIGDPGADTNTIFKAVVTDAAAATIGLDIVDVEGKVDDLETRLGTPSDLGSGATVAANLVDIEGQTDNLPAIETKIDTIDGIVDDILLDTAEIGAAGAGLTNINLPNQTMDIVGNITGNLSGSVGSVTGAVGSVTGNVGGNVTGSVGSVAANGISASSLAADAVDEILDEAIGDGSVTMRQALRVILAGMAGKLSGAATTTVTIRNTADSADVIVATVDADGNRSAVTVTP